MIKKLLVLYVFMFALIMGCSNDTTDNSSNDNTSKIDNITVTFHSNNGVDLVEVQHINANEYTALMPNKFVYNGYSFTGWSKTVNGDILYLDCEEIITDKNIDLYAVWERTSQTHILSFDANGGFGSMSSLNVSINGKIKLPKNTFEKTDFIFMGWSETKNGNIKYYDEDEIVVNSNMTLFAVWQQPEPEDKATIVFDANNNTNESKVEIYKKGESYKLPYNTFKYGAKKFIGWSVNKDATEPDYMFIDGGEVWIDKSMKLFAVWSDNAYTITFDANHGEGHIVPIHVNKGQQVILPYVTYTRFNYRSLGWNDSTNELPGPHYAEGYKYTMPERNVTLYVNWVIIDGTLGGAQKDLKGQKVAVAGVKLPDDSEFQQEEQSQVYNMSWKKEHGVYSVAQEHWRMCWAATASNILHWWLEYNKEYIAKYEKYTAPHKYYYTAENGKKPHSSDIFEDFKKYWHNDGNNTKQGFFWYLNGRDDGIQGGAYFKEIFEGAYLVDTLPGYVNKRTFNEAIGDAIRNHKAIGTAGTGHETTIWGAIFDDEGYVSHIYSTNSNNPGILSKIPIKYGEDGSVLRHSINNKWYPIGDLQVFDNGKKYWDEYFNSIGK